MPEPWDRLPDEPSLWYERFDRFRLLGPERSIEEAYRVASGTKGQRRHPGSWGKAVKAWNWHARATAWDDAQRAARSKHAEAALARARAEQLALSVTGMRILTVKLAALEQMDATYSDVVKLGEFVIKLQNEVLSAPLIDEIRAKLKAMEDGGA